MPTALLLSLALLATDASAADTGPGEPLPPGAPTDDYLLTGWCLGALGTYIDIYNVVKPDLIEIDKQWGTPVKEAEPYSSDMAGAREELKVFAAALEAAEKASPRPISQQGALAIKQGQAIWRPVQMKTRRELARAWLTWGLPDRCGVVARQLTARSNLLGRALTYNANPGASEPAAAPTPAPGVSTLRPIAPVTQVAPEARPAAAPVETAIAPPPSAAPPPAADPAPPPVDVATAQAPAPAPAPARVMDEPPPAAAAAPAPPRPIVSQPAMPQPAAAAPAAPTPASDESSEPVL